MNRMIKIGLMGLALTAAMQSAALAQYGSKVSRFVNELRSQGYRNVEVQRTLMGRYKIEAKKGGDSREIIIDPNTGHVFRDRRERDDERSHGSNGGYSNSYGDNDHNDGYDDSNDDDHGSYGGSNDDGGYDDHNDGHDSDHDSGHDSGDDDGHDGHDDD